MAVLTDDRAGQRAFWRYWWASAVSRVGDSVTSVALPLVAIGVLAAGPLGVGLLTAAGYAAWLVIGLPAGVIVRHLPPRETQVAMDLIRAVALLSIPVAVWAGRLTLAQLIAVALVVNLAQVIFSVGNMTLLPAVVPREQLTARNSLMSGTDSVTQLGGPGLGGLLVQLFGAAAALVVDVASYLVSAVLMRALPRPPRVPLAAAPPIRAQIAQGWRFVTRHPVMLPCMLDATAINFVNGGLQALIPLYLVRTLGASPAIVGLLLATEGVGALAGAALVTRLVTRFGSARVTVLSGFVGAALAMLLPLGAGRLGMACFAAGNAGFALATVITSVCTRTHRQTASPPELLSRVMATVRFVSWGVIPFGALLGGAVAAATSTRAALWLFAGLAVVGPLVVLASPVRRLRHLDDPVS